VELHRSHETLELPDLEPELILHRFCTASAPFRTASSPLPPLFCTASEPLLDRFCTASAPLSHRFRTASTPPPHCLRTASTPRFRFRTVSGLLGRNNCWQNEWCYSG
jgi:hypothetical protein